MRRRVEEHIPAAEADRQLKLGPGGLRDVEFAVQLLQLVHGRTDATLRSATTLVALEALATGGYVGRDDAAALAAAYRFLRTLEHRIQLHRLRRTHLVPDGRGRPAPPRPLAGAVAPTRSPSSTEEWRRHAREVRRLHEKLFYRPLLHAVARLAADEARLTPEAARARLEALGYADPAARCATSRRSPPGVTRRAAIQRTLLPVMLGWFADAPDPDAGLLGVPPGQRRARHDALVPAAAARRGRRRRAARPPAVASSRLRHRPAAARARGGRDARRRRRAPPRGAGRACSARCWPRRRRGRRPGDARSPRCAACAAASCSGSPPPTCSACLDVAAVGRGADRHRRGHPGRARCEAAHRGRGGRAGRAAADPVRGRSAMGRFGGGELGYGSDADVLFVHDPLPGADEREAARRRARGRRPSCAGCSRCPRRTRR